MKKTYGGGDTKKENIYRIDPVIAMKMSNTHFLTNFFKNTKKEYKELPYLWDMQLVFFFFFFFVKG